uniref:Secreted protein n=1 Tax=Steinernema glaseri TaxID=37863 RepID=A0A1I7ZHN5_9BILA
MNVPQLLIFSLRSLPLWRRTHDNNQSEDRNLRARTRPQLSTDCFCRSSARDSIKQFLTGPRLHWTKPPRGSRTKMSIWASTDAGGRQSYYPSSKSTSGVGRLLK